VLLRNFHISSSPADEQGYCIVEQEEGRFYAHFYDATDGYISLLPFYGTLIFFLSCVVVFTYSFCDLLAVLSSFFLSCLFALFMSFLLSFFLRQLTASYLELDRVTVDDRDNGLHTSAMTVLHHCSIINCSWAGVEAVGAPVCRYLDASRF
jgi:hypothetical protein